MYILGGRILLVGQHFKGFGATLFQPTNAREITVWHLFNLLLSPTETSRNDWETGPVHYR